MMNRWKMMIPLTAMITVLCGNMVYADSSSNVWHMGEVQAKEGEGYGTNQESDDEQYGSELGHFKLSGYTRKIDEKNGNMVFLKNVNDKVELSFELEQDINALHGDEDLYIEEDKAGYDDAFGVHSDARTNFGKGVLLVKKTDYQNKTSYVEPYTNYLMGVEKGATTDIQFLEEGDYEIVLDYMIRNKGILNTFPFVKERYYYQIKAKFSIRNGNCMVYPFDVKTGSELVNAAFTENGFRLDLAKSRYLTIDVKKQNYVEDRKELVEDIRFNRAASDGEIFTEEGVYTITVRNIYTNAETEKKIYVGQDPALKAYVTTGKNIAEIKKMVSEGATINANGSITIPKKDDFIANHGDEMSGINQTTEGRLNTGVGKWFAGIFAFVSAIILSI